MKKLLLILLCLPFIGFGQTRYLDDIFPSVTVTSDVTYATNISILPMLQGLPPAAAPINCDIYEPTGDTETDRPVIILAHTGSFLPPVINGQATGSKTDLSIVEQCTRWAKKGYVAVAMSYRLGWNPTSTDQNTRSSTLIQAMYRGIQDARSLIRFMRQEEANGDPYGIDGSKIVFGGQGTGGYLSLGVATLDTTAELFLTKFLDLSDPSNPIPYVSPSVFGNIWGTDMGYMPLYDNLGNIIGQDTFALPNNIGYSSDISMVFNIGGCLADISWLEDGDAPMVSFHCAKDAYFPYANGDIIVPTTGDFVIEAQGSYIVQKHQDMYGNNAPFASTSFTDPITAQSVINNTTYDTINNYPVGNNYEGLYTFITPPHSTTSNAYGEYEVEQSAPWDWWDNAAYGAMAQAVNGIPGLTTPAYFEANAILSNPNMGPTNGNLYLDTIHNYLNARIFITLGLAAAPGCTDSLACNFNASANVDDGSCILPDGCTDPLYLEYDATAQCDDGSCATLIVNGCTDTLACNFNASANVDDGSCTYFISSTDSIATCNSFYNWPLNGQTYTVSGTYTNYINNISPTLAGNYNTPGAAWGVTVNGNYAYVADGTGLQIIDISNPSNPTLTGTYGTSNARGVSINSNYAYVANYTLGLQIIDISNPSNPTLTGTYSPSNFTHNVSVNGNYAYVAVSTDGLQIIDISNPSNPTLTGTYNTSGNAYNVSVNGNYAYVADDYDGLQVIDISNPSNPTLIGTYNTNGDAYNVSLNGNYAYVADGYDGLKIIDISNHSNLTLIGTYNTPGFARSISINGNYAFVADNQYGLQIIDISNPYNPTITGIYDTPGNARSVSINGNYAYVADEGSGLQIIDITPNCILDSLILSINVCGCTDSLASNYNPSAYNDDGSCFYCDISFNPPIYQDNTSNTACDGFIIVSATSSAIPITYNWSNAVNGPNNLNLCTGIYTITATDANGCSVTDTFTIGQIIYGCMNPLVSNYNPSANMDDGSCCIDGCTDSIAFNYNPSATCDDGSCISVLNGCTDANASNYDSLANIDDGSCYYCDVSISLIAFQDPTPGYCNGLIISSATSSYSSVTYSWNTGSTSNILTSLCLGIYELTVTDSLGCFATQTYTLGNVIFGCTDSTACNYNASAHVDDGSCILPDGCIDPLYIEYDANAQCDDGSCATLIVNGCTDTTAFNYDPAANTDDGSCIAIVFGCTDPSASNYNPLANSNDGTCITPGCTPLTSPGMSPDTQIGLSNSIVGQSYNQYISIFNEVNVTVFILGTSLNATLDYIIIDSIVGLPSNFTWNCDSSCTMPAGISNCFNIYSILNPTNLDIGVYPITIHTTSFYSNVPLIGTMQENNIISGYSIEIIGMSGCTDPLASNYDPLATTDDGSCIYLTCNEDAPTGLFTSNVIHNRATINWDNMNSNVCVVDQYRIRYRETGTSSWSTKTMSGPVGSCNFASQKTDKLILNLTANTNYEYQMKAWYCGGGASSWSAIETFTTLDNCPNVGNLAVYGATPTKATFTWDASNGVYAFVRLKARIDSISNPTGADFFQIGGAGVSYGTFTKNKNGLIPSQTYRGQARTYCDPNGGGWKSLSWTPLVYWTQPTLRIEGGNAIANLAIYPNPSKDVFNITFTSERVQDLRVRVLNVVGEEIVKEELQQYIGEYTKQINLEDNAKGIYFLEIETNEGIINKKLVLQ